MKARVGLSRSAVQWGALTFVLAAGLSACGGGSSGGSSSASTTAAPSGAPAGVPGLDPDQLKKIQDCLSAAGISGPSGMPSGTPSTMPSRMPSGAAPSGMPGGAAPSGMPGGAGFNDPKAQAALKACGLAMPSMPAGGPQASASS